jgi:hypothetical protein
VNFPTLKTFGGVGYRHHNRSWAAPTHIGRALDGGGDITTRLEQEKLEAAINEADKPDLVDPSCVQLLAT